jgi:CheY-like chemotaxis protein/signal transduction histidine kinase/HAMP domain-containing protein
VASNSQEKKSDRAGQIINSVYVDDVYFDGSLNQATMAYAIPISKRETKSKPFAILVAKLNLMNSLYKLLLSRNGMGETGETLIVNQKSVALNELRFHPQAPLNLKIKAYPAVQASSGFTGIVEAEDYRKELVLAAYTHIDEMHWGFVSKQDLAEIYQPIDDLVTTSLLILLISMVIVYFLSLKISASVSAPVVAISNVAKRFKEGEYDLRSTVTTEDELKSLSASFNGMADSLSHQMQVLKSVQSVMNIVVQSDSSAEFCNTVLNQLIQISDSCAGVFYGFDSKRNKFRVESSQGLNKNSIKDVLETELQGEMLKCFESGDICLLKDIPEDCQYCYHTLMGDIRPKTQITLPIQVFGKVHGIVSLISLHEYSNTHKDIIYSLWQPLTTGFSNLISSELTAELANGLEESNLELERQKGELQKKSEELQNQNLELEIQRKQVEQANSLKSQFLSNMSHELRTPLNSILALSRVMISDPESSLNPEQNKYLEVIERNGKRLLTLINDILDLSKIEAGRMELNISRFDMNHTIERLVDNLGVICREKGIEISFEGTAKECYVHSDESRITQVLQNLLSNAVKFTEKGSVTARLFREEDEISIIITDTGIGIAKAELEHIFDEFRQVDGSSARKFEGTGLGLAIAKKAINLLGGEMRVSSTLNKGTSFTVSFPSIVRKDSWLSQQTREYSVSHDAVSKILVVDDDPQVLSKIGGYFEDEGFTVVTASNGEQALTIAQNEELFAISLDVVMPGTSGFEVLRRLKANEHTRDIPVFMVSVSKDFSTGFALGAVGFVQKPVDKGSLLEQLGKICKQSFNEIMVVDDEEFDRNRICAMLEEEEIKAFGVEDGETCLDILENMRPDAIILDLIMPKFDGLAVLEALRKTKNGNTIPVLIVTAKDITHEDKVFMGRYSAACLNKQNLETSRLNMRLFEAKKLTDKMAQQPSLETPKQVLIAEDNEDLILQMRSVLHRHDFLMDVARDGQEALDYLSEKVPDVLILDLMMPVVDGYEVLKKIRASESTKELPVMVLTAKDLSAHDVELFRKYGIQFHIQKGDVNQDTFVSCLHLMLGNEPKSESKEVQTIKSGKEKSILVIEDNPDNVLALKAILGRRYNLIEAYDGRVGLELCVSESPDIVLLDISLPDMDGYEVISLIRENKELEKLPVIALSAHAMKGVREKVIEHGCDDYLSKPVEPDKLLDMLERYLKKSQEDAG